MAALAAVLPVNVWIYAGQLQNLRAAGRKFILQGGTHRNMAVVKAQVDFIRGKVPDAEVVLHPYPGEAGAIGAALCAADWKTRGEASHFRGFDTIAALTYNSTTSAATVCKWCPINCTRTFIDVQLPDAKGREWSKLPLAPGRVAQPLPRVRGDRGADLHLDDQRGDGVQVVPDQLHAHVHRRGAARGARPRVEQAPARPGLGARDQRQFLPQGPGRGRQ